MLPKAVFEAVSPHRLSTIAASSPSLASSFAGGRSPLDNTPGSLTGLCSPSLQLPAASTSGAARRHTCPALVLPITAAASFSGAACRQVFSAVPLPRTPPVNNEDSVPPVNNEDSCQEIAPPVSNQDSASPVNNEDSCQEIAPPVNNEDSAPVELPYLLGRTSGPGMVQAETIVHDKEEQQFSASWPVSRAACVHDEALHCAISAREAFLARMQRIRGRQLTSCR